jgi:hypothetical protein
MPLPPPLQGLCQRSWMYLGGKDPRPQHRQKILAWFLPESATQATWAHNVQNICRHCSNCGELNFPRFDGAMPDLDPVPRYVAFTRGEQGGSRAARGGASPGGVHGGAPPPLPIARRRGAMFVRVVRHARRRHRVFRHWSIYHASRCRRLFFPSSSSSTSRATVTCHW